MSIANSKDQFWSRLTIGCLCHQKFLSRLQSCFFFSTKSCENIITCSIYAPRLRSIQMSRIHGEWAPCVWSLNPSTAFCKKASRATHVDTVLHMTLQRKNNLLQTYTYATIYASLTMLQNLSLTQEANGDEDN